MKIMISPLTKTMVWAIACCGSIWHLSANAATMKVLVANGTEVNDASLAIDVIAALNLSNISTPGLATKNYVLANFPAVSVPAFCGDNGDGNLQSEVACAAAQLEGVRNSLDADIVVMAVDQGLNFVSGVFDGVCGAAPFSSDQIAQSNHAFGYAVVDKGCIDVYPFVSSHEVGHLLGLEHEIESGHDGNQSIPQPDNHGWISASGAHTTIMRSFTNPSTANVYSNLISTLGLENEPAGLLGSANAARVIAHHSWLAVSNYREPAPAACNVRFEFSHCQGTTAIGALTALLPGYIVTNADYDVSINGGSWIDIFEGILTCPVLNVGIGGSMIGLAVLDTPHGQSQCTVTIQTSLCGGGGGGGGRHAF